MGRAIAAAGASMTTETLNRRLVRLTRRWPGPRPRIEDLSDEELLRIMARGQPNPAAFLRAWANLADAEQTSWLSLMARGEPLLA